MDSRVVRIDSQVVRMDSRVVRIYSQVNVTLHVSGTICMLILMIFSNTNACIVTFLDDFPGSLCPH